MFDDGLTDPVGRWGLLIRRNELPAGRPELAAIGAELDASPFGALWIAGSPPGDLGLPAAVLAGSERLLVGTSITNVWDTDPAEVAAAAARLRAEHGDRLVIGVGAGHAPDAERTGRAYTRPLSKVVDYLDALDAAETPVPPARRALAALGPRMLELARDRAGGALPYLTTARHTREARRILGEGPLLVPEHKVVLETDPARARAVGRDVVGWYLGMPNYLASLARLGWGEEDTRDGGSDALIDALVLWGDTASIVERLTEHLDAGADHVAVQPLHPEKRYPREQIAELGAALAGAPVR